MNHKAKHKYNYEELLREMVYLKTSLNMLAEDLKGNPKKLAKRLVKDIERKLDETSQNLKQNAAEAKN